VPAIIVIRGNSLLRVQASACFFEKHHLKVEL